MENPAVKTTGIVLYSLMTLYMLTAMWLLWKRRHLPIILHRTRTLVMLSAVSSWLLLTYFLISILLGPNQVPSLLTVFLGIFLTSLYTRPYLLRMHYLLMSLSLLSKNPDHFYEFSQSLMASTLDNPLFVGWIFFLLSLLLDVGLGLLVSCLSPNALEPGYVVLQDWYLFAAFLVVYLGYRTMLFLRISHGEIYGIQKELTVCMVAFLVLGCIYIGSLFSGFAAVIGDPYNRYFIFSAMVLVTFSSSVTFPVLCSYWVDVFEVDPQFLHQPHLKTQETLSGDITLKSVLSNDATASSFQIFLAKELSAENLFFYRMVEKFRKPDEHVTEEVRLKWAKAIVKRFLTHGSAAEVNVSVPTRKGILEAIQKDHVSINTFDMAEKEIFEMMERDSLPRFLKHSTAHTFTQHEEFLNPTVTSGVTPLVIITAY